MSSLLAAGNDDEIEGVVGLELGEGAVVTGGKFPGPCERPERLANARFSVINSPLTHRQTEGPTALCCFWLLAGGNVAAAE